MEKRYLAADSGGSKTKWVLLDETGRTAAVTETGGLGAVRAGILPVEETVRSAAERLEGQLPPHRVFLSLGGPNVDEVESALKSVWGDVPVSVEREACGKSILAAAAYLGCGSVVMCGTGSTAVGNTGEGLRFCGGWGPVYGDGGSGGGMGSDALKLFLRSLDGLEEAGRIGELFRTLTDGVDVKGFYGRMEVKRRALDLSRRELAALAPKIWALAEAGDEAARMLYRRAAEDIADMAAAVTDDDPGASVLLCGGFAAGKPAFLEMCREALGKKSRAVLRYEPAFSPAVSAEMAVLRESGIPVTEEIAENILKGAKI